MVDESIHRLSAAQEVLWDRQSKRMTARYRAKRDRERFVAGPIPELWLARASKLNHKALAVGLCLWKQAGLKRRQSALNLSAAAIDFWDIGRNTKSRALKELEAAGLIRVERVLGKLSSITILATSR